MSEQDRSFGDWLKQKLLERQMPLLRLSRAAGIDYAYLWRLINRSQEGGRRRARVPSYALTVRIGDALDAPREALAAAGYDYGLNPEAAADADRLDRQRRDLAALEREIDASAAPDLDVGGTCGIPVLGQVQAGSIHEAIADAGEHVMIPGRLLGDPDFLLRVRGDSMSPTLVEGDLVGIRTQAQADPGQLVVAAIDEEITLKRYDLVAGQPVLLADNPAWRPVSVTSRARIVGVVTGSYRPPEVLRRRPAG